MESKRFNRSDRPKRNSSRSDKPRSDRKPLDRPKSDRPKSDRPKSDRPYRTDRPRRDGDFKARGPRSDRPMRRDQRDNRDRRIKKDFFKDPLIPDEITGEELEKNVRGDLLTLSAENAKVVARHLSCVNMYALGDPDLAYQHAMAASRHAGRVAIVRETAGYAAYRVGKFGEAIKELRAAYRINGDPSVWPVLADCERGLGKPLKALALAGAPEVKKLQKEQAVEMRIVTAGARRDMGDFEAAVVTLQSDDLNISNQPWSIRLRYAYADALSAVGRTDEARKWFARTAEIDVENETDASERC